MKLTRWAWIIAGPCISHARGTDPEQNHAFNDHYLEVDYDLSDVMFVYVKHYEYSYPITWTVWKSFEFLHTEDEKLSIARKYLLPKQVKVNVEAR